MRIADERQWQRDYLKPELDCDKLQLLIGCLSYHPHLEDIGHQLRSRHADTALTEAEASPKDYVREQWQVSR